MFLYALEMVSRHVKFTQCVVNRIKQSSPCSDLRKAAFITVLILSLDFIVLCVNREK